jgi:two-component system NtrC family response regulator
MREVFATLARIAPTEIAVMLLGETGTGKSLLARAIHAASAHAAGPFVIIECAAMDPKLVAADLFGSGEEAGAPGANEGAGAFERAEGGTLFLNELCELPLELQPRLLRVLESRSVRRGGGTGDRPVDARILAASQADPKQRVAEGRLRGDLYFRLASTVVAVPPLRERVADLPLIIERVLEKVDRDDVRLSADAFDLLQHRSWPGNVRQLENVLTCALAFADDGVIDAEHLRAACPDSEKSVIDRLPLGGVTLENIERVAIKQTLALTGGMKVRAAEILGIAVSTLYQKLKKYGL